MKTLLIALTLGGIILTGCSPTYNIEPSYDKQNKVIMIDDYKIDYVSYDTSKENLNFNMDTNTYKMFKAQDEQCRKLAYKTLSAGTNRYYHTSGLDDILQKYNNNCKIEQIGNINFFSCVAKTKINKDNKKLEAKNIHYGATSSYSNQYGYSDKTTLFLGNTKNCFENIKEHFANKTKPEYIKITKKIKFDKNIKFYTGKFNAEDDICVKQGDIEFYIDNDKLKGHISFERKGKKIHPKLWGKIIKNKVSGETIKLKFNGELKNNTIKGTYKNKVCKGTFKVKLNK